MTELIKWNENNIRYMFRSWDGPTGRYIATRAERLAVLAKGSAGVRTGALKSAIGTKYGRRSGELEVKVGANPHLPDSRGRRGYGFYHHEGTLPHKITAKNGRALRFAVAGNTLYRKSVQHPGTEPNRYLTRHLKEVIRK